MAMSRILFLCHANLCLSPLAEGLLKSICQKRRIEANIDSAGFEAYHINEFPDKRALKLGKEYGIDISKKKVRLFSRDDFDKFDKIYVIDALSKRNALYFARNEDDKSKIDYLMNLINPGKNESVLDCFYDNLGAWNETFKILEKACNLIADEMIKD